MKRPLPVSHKRVKGQKNRSRGPAAVCRLRRQVSGNKLPVNQRPEVVQIAWTGVAIVDVVACSQTSTVSSGFASVVSGVPALLVETIARLPSAFLTSQVQPAPKFFAAASVNLALKSAKLPKDLAIAAASSPSVSPPGVRLQAVPVEGVVPDLRCVVEYTFRSADDLFEGFYLECSAFDQVVEVSDIRLVVFTVVVFRFLCGNVRREGVFAYGNAGNSNDIAALRLTFLFISH